jgi:very-short-patch-repair endonuclease
VTQRQLRTLVRNGELIKFHRGSYVTRAAVEWARDNPRRQHVLNVYVAMGSARGAVPSHQSAAVMHGIKLLNHLGDTVTLTMSPDKQRSGEERAGVILHAADLPGEHLDTLYRVPVTNGARTMADLARTLPFMEAVVAADSALNLELASKTEVEVVLERCKGWPGAQQAKRVLAFADGNAGSPLESCGRVIIREHGIEPPQVQVNIRGDHYSYYADLGWEKRKTLVEFDGMGKYRSEDEGKNQAAIEAQFERDRVFRDAGYQVVHVTWDELFTTPDVVIGRIRKAFASSTAF